MLRHARTAIATLLLIGCGSSCSAPEGRRRHGRQRSGGGSASTRRGDADRRRRPHRHRRPPAPAARPARRRPARWCSRATSAALLTLGPPCTWEEGATGDRWCAFIAASVSIAGEQRAVRRQRHEGGRRRVDHLRPGRRQLPEADQHLRRGRPSPGAVPGATRWSTTTSRGDAVRVAAGHDRGRVLAVADPTTRTCCCARPTSRGPPSPVCAICPMAMQTDPANLFLSDVLAGQSMTPPTPPLARSRR